MKMHDACLYLFMGEDDILWLYEGEGVDEIKSDMLFSNGRM